MPDALAPRAYAARCSRPSTTPGRELRLAVAAVVEGGRRRGRDDDVRRVGAQGLVQADPQSARRAGPPPAAASPGRATGRCRASTSSTPCTTTQCGTSMPRSAAAIGHSSAVRGSVRDRSIRRCEPRRRTTSSSESDGGTSGSGAAPARARPSRPARRRAARPCTAATRPAAARRRRRAGRADRRLAVAEGQQGQRVLVHPVRADELAHRRVREQRAQPRREAGARGRRRQLRQQRPAVPVQVPPPALGVTPAGPPRHAGHHQRRDVAGRRRARSGRARAAPRRTSARRPAPPRRRACSRRPRAGSAPRPNRTARKRNSAAACARRCARRRRRGTARGRAAPRRAAAPATGTPARTAVAGTPGSGRSRGRATTGSPSG